MGRPFRCARIVSVSLCVVAGAGWLAGIGPEDDPLGDAGELPSRTVPVTAGAHRPPASLPRGLPGELPSSTVSAYRPPGSPPRRLRGPHHLSATVVPVATAAGGALNIPPGRDTAGWWALGAAPGDERGTVLIAGHLDTPAGPAAFAALRPLALGQRVELATADGTAHAYRVTARRTYHRQDLPADLFTATGPARLALVTCTGSYDHARHRYTRNLVLYATPVPSGPP
ncbi:class F sortase [Streptomyces sp. NPDC003077]|uniref:class F sortase n=1 Tax=Streptomyces sp. NPDC003077 TaxID=3154443 RepID=UPI0033BA4E99